MTAPDNSARNARILDMYREGLRPFEIAAALGMSVNAVKAVTFRERKAGRLPPVPNAHAALIAELRKLDTANMTLKRLMTATGRGDTAVRTALRQLGQTFRRAPRGWPAHTRQIGGDPRAKRREAMKVCPPRPVLGPAPADPSPMGCRYIIGEPGEPGYRYCGDRRRAAAEPYCRCHHELCHVRVERAAA